MTPISQEIIKALETTTISNFIIVFLIPAVLFVYAYLVVKKDWSAVMGGLAFFAADVFNELVNTIWMFSSDYAPLWGTPKAASTGWLLLPGWCFEIVCMFLIGAVPFILIDRAFKKEWMGPQPVTAQSEFLHGPCKGPDNFHCRMEKIAGLYESQWVISLAGCVLAVVVEVLLNRAGLLTWEWDGWGGGGILSLVPVFVFGYLWFYYFAFWVSNRPTLEKQATAVGILATIDVVLFIFCLCRDWIITYSPPLA